MMDVFVRGLVTSGVRCNGFCFDRQAPGPIECGGSDVAAALVHGTDLSANRWCLVVNTATAVYPPQRTDSAPFRHEAASGERLPAIAGFASPYCASDAASVAC